MKPLISSIAVSLVIFSMPLSAKPIYKCQVDGAVKFTEEPCDDKARPVELKGLAAPLEPFDLSKVKGLNTTAKASAIEARIALRHKRIHQYLVKMNKELESLGGQDKKSEKNTPRNSLKDKDIETQLKSIADNSAAVLKGSLAAQRNTIINHYRSLIEVEQFYISVLLKKLHVLRVIEGTEVGTTD